jgi:hypothetical protein
VVVASGILLRSIPCFLFGFLDPLDPLPPWLEEVLDQSFEVQSGGMRCFGLHFEVL